MSGARSAFRPRFVEREGQRHRVSRMARDANDEDEEDDGGPHDVRRGGWRRNVGSDIVAECYCDPMRDLFGAMTPHWTKTEISDLEGRFDFTLALAWGGAPVPGHAAAAAQLRSPQPRRRAGVAPVPDDPRCGASAEDAAPRSLHVRVLAPRANVKDEDLQGHRRVALHPQRRRRRPPHALRVARRRRHARPQPASQRSPALRPRRPPLPPSSKARRCALPHWRRAEHRQEGFGCILGATTAPKVTSTLRVRRAPHAAADARASHGAMSSFRCPSARLISIAATASQLRRVTSSSSMRRMSSPGSTVSRSAEPSRSWPTRGPRVESRMTTGADGRAATSRTPSWRERASTAARCTSLYLASCWAHSSKSVVGLDGASGPGSPRLPRRRRCSRFASGT